MKYNIGDIVELRKDLKFYEVYDWYEYYPEMYFEKGKIIRIANNGALLIGKIIPAGTDAWWYPPSMLRTSSENILIDYIRKVGNL